MLERIFPRDRKLGVAEGRRRYDLPLNKSEGAGFLLLLIALMSFLALMAESGYFALSAVAHRWSSGLENKLTIEIGAEKEDGTLHTPEEIQEMTQKVGKALEAHPAVREYEIFSAQDTQELVSPWLGDAGLLEDITLPGLVAVTLNLNTPSALETLEESVRRAAANARIDTHESWLADILRLTGAMRLSAFLILLIIGGATVITIAGAIQARIAIHRDDIELLHLMGASDEYITRQFQHHGVVTALQGGAIGTLAGLLLLGLGRLIAGDMAAGLLPDFSPGALQILILLALPLMVAAVAAVTVRHTVLRALARMP